MKPITASLAVMTVLCGVLVAPAMPAPAQTRSEADICEQLSPEDRPACRMRIEGAASAREGGPTFTPVRPAIPGRTPAETPSASPATDTPTGAAPGMLQISPPATPILQVPEPPPQRGATSPVESTR